MANKSFKKMQRSNRKSMKTIGDVQTHVAFFLDILFFVCYNKKRNRNKVECFCTLG